MTETPDRTESVFAAAVGLASAEERAAYLDQACAGDAALRGHVEALLRAHERAGHLLDRPIPGGLERTGAYIPREQPGTVIAGRYKLLEAIGEGGMGAVWVAEQTQPVRRKVAVKLIKVGMDSKSILARFEAERQALAVMDHPNIAKVLDGGLTDTGQPFFVMEYIKGVPITEYCDATRLSVPERLQLFVQVCSAVQHAHHKGIIHRDLKPSNILVAPYDDRPVPKVIDFGLAKAMHQSLTERTLHTAHETVLGTPLYMSPEQAQLNNLDVDTRSDIYSLGVLLYEMLTGTTPLEKKRFKEAAWDEVRRIIREEEPPRPSTRLSSSQALASLAAGRHTEPARLTKLVRGELDWIVMKSLEKDRARRYETANGFAMDIQRYLAGEPVQAHPPSTAYRLRKFVRRYKGQVLAASLVLLALVGGIVGTTLGLFEARRQEQEAQQEAEKAKKARDFLVSVFQKAERDQKGANVTVRQLLEEADTRIPVEFAGQPELRADLVKVIGEVKRGIARRTAQAMILEVRGTVTLHSHQGGAKRAIPQALVNLDDRLSLGADGDIQLVFLSDLHKERLKAGREVIIDSRDCEPADAVRERDDSVLMTFVRLPKGTFFMGWTGTPGSPKKTEIKEDFEIAVHDLTQGQWQAVMGNNPSWFSREGNGRNAVVNVSDEELKLFPVEQVSWDDVQTFLKKLNEKERGCGYLYRLPTEPEWEYACRGGATSLEECSYHFYIDKPANDLSSEEANFNGNFPFGKAPKGPYLDRPTRVGAYPGNKLGLCDMHGNLKQWTDTAQDSGRVCPGAGWGNTGAHCRAASRWGFPMTVRYNSLGFRLARVSVR